jgi:predicted metalloendopeptidase
MLCSNILKGVSILSLLVRKHFNEKAKLAMEEMVRDIRVEFDTILSQIAWMDEKTRKRAKVTDILTFPWRRW